MQCPPTSAGSLSLAWRWHWCLAPAASRGCTTTAESQTAGMRARVVPARRARLPAREPARCDRSGSRLARCTATVRRRRATGRPRACASASWGPRTRSGHRLRLVFGIAAAPGSARTSARRPPTSRSSSKASSASTPRAGTSAARSMPWCRNRCPGEPGQCRGCSPHVPRRGARLLHRSGDHARRQRAASTSTASISPAWPALRIMSCMQRPATDPQHAPAAAALGCPCACCWACCMLASAFAGRLTAAADDDFPRSTLEIRTCARAADGSTSASPTPRPGRNSA